MDPLALLCNLHADGPATLQRLRRAGCESLAALQRLSPVELGERLEWSVRAAERFLREAALLGARVENDGEEEAPFELESTLLAELDDQAEEDESELAEADFEAEEPAPPEEALAPATERIEALLGTWRELDRVAPPSAPEDFVIPRPAAPVDLSLDGVVLEGLTPSIVRACAANGVRTLRELLAAPELELARQVGLGFTRLRRLRFLAERTLESRVASEPPAPLPARTETFTPAPHEPFETAGPFA
jgi:hypothetical protein